MLILARRPYQGFCAASPGRILYGCEDLKRGDRDTFENACRKNNIWRRGGAPTKGSTYIVCRCTRRPIGRKTA